MRWQQRFGEKEQQQESRYAFPYHYLPYEKNNAWHIGRYEVQGFRYLSLLETVTHYVKQLHPSRLLDFGCGDGRLLNDLAQIHQGDLVGVDISQRALWLAQAAAAPYPHVQFFRDLDDIPAEPFDMIVAMEVIEHIPPDMLLGLMGRLNEVLSENGRFLITVPSINEPLAAKHYQHFDRDSLIKALHGHFEIEDLFYLHKTNLSEKILQRTVVNRFFMTTWKPWLRFATQLYRNKFVPATPTTGRGLLAICRKLS